MKEVVNQFLAKIKEKEHVQLLMKQADFRIDLSSGQERIPLAIKKGEISVLSESDERSINYQIRGDSFSICQLVEGKERLRLLERKGKIQIASPLRIALLVESIFYLTGRGNPKSKENNLS